MTQILTTISAQPQTCFDGKMAFHTKPAFPTIQRAICTYFRF